MAVRIDTAMSQAGDATAAIYRNFQNSAGCSMEQIFTPVAINKSGNAPTPGFRPNQQSPYEQGLFAGNSVGPTIRELNPYFPRKIISGDEDGSQFFENCDYNAVVMQPATDLSRAKTDLTSVQSVRTKGLRAPVILSGWGFDLADLPVPYGQNAYAFDTNLVSDRRYWKSGPLDVKWDEERQVWSGGPQIVCGWLEAGVDIPAGKLTSSDAPTFEITLLRDDRYAERRGLTSLGEKIKVINRDESLELKDTTNKVFVIAVRVNYEWLPLWVGCGND